MGLDNLDKLGLIKEDIGLKEKVVLMDYLSPPISPIRYQGACLSKAEVDKCRNVILNQEMARDINNGRGQKQSKKCINEEEVNLGYYVEFPVEERGEKMTTGKSLSQEKEIALVQVVNNSLSLKRYRVDQQEQGEEEQDSRDGFKKRLKQMLCLEGASAVGEEKTQDNFNKMAEEAGLTMPHQGPLVL